MFSQRPYLITVAETHEFRKAAETLMAGEEIDALVEFLALNPDGGDVIPDTGGIRELLWKKSRSPEQEGVWVIYFFYDLNLPLYAISVFPEGEYDELMDREREGLRQLVEDLVAAHSERLRGHLQSGA